MSKLMISVRIPVSLVNELKEVSKKDHFLDLSESVRSIIRQNWFRYRNPQAFEITKLRKEITEALLSRNQDDILGELRKIKDTIVKKKMSGINRTRISIVLFLILASALMV